VAYAPKVVFDFPGSLRLARLSWHLADLLDQLARRRSEDARSALTDWTGAYAGEFAVRIDDEIVTAARLSEQLRAEAGGWAMEWKQAMDQENYNRYQAACARVRSRRNGWDNFTGALFGHDDLPSQPDVAPTPVAPDYLATRQFADYSRY
jgi:hypothetical protein